MADKAKRKGGGRLNRSETVTVRLDPKLRYLAELAARKQRRTLSSFIAWAIEDSLQHVYVEEGRDPQSQAPYQLSMAQVAFDVWDVDEAERFVRLALRYPDLLTYEEQVLWKLIQENGSLWQGTHDDHGWLSWDMSLERLAMRKLLPGETLMEHGITFERLANADGVFTVNIMVDGQRIHRVIGREAEGTTRTQAELFIEKVRRDARQGRLQLPQGRKIALGFREAATRYLQRLGEEGGKDLVMKRRRLNLHLVPFFSDMPLSQLSTFDVERYKKSRVGEGAKVGTVNREIAALSHLLNKGIEWGWIDKRPATIKRYAEDHGRITSLTVEQMQRLIEAAKQDQNPQVYPKTRRAYFS